MTDQAEGFSERWNVEIVMPSGKMRIRDVYWVERQHGRWLPAEAQAIGRGEGDA